MSREDYTSPAAARACFGAPLILLFRVPVGLYRDFFADLLADSSQSQASRTLLEEALTRTESSPYELWRWEATLKSDGSDVR